MSAPTITRESVLGCGCRMVSDVDGNGRRAAERCPEADRLWAELVEARDAMRAGEREGKGRKRRIDAFAAKRGAYHGHVEGSGG